MIGLQETHECYFFVADWHALTTGYRDTSMLGPYTTEMVLDWLAAGLDPGKCTIYRPVSYTHLRAHETRHELVCRLLLEKKKTHKKKRASEERASVQKKEDKRGDEKR